MTRGFRPPGHTWEDVVMPAVHDPHLGTPVRKGPRDGSPVSDGVTACFQLAGVAPLLASAPLSEGVTGDASQVVGGGGSEVIGRMLPAGAVPGRSEYLLHGILDDVPALGLDNPGPQKRLQALQGFLLGEGFDGRQVGKGPFEDVILEGLTMQGGNRL